MKIEYDSFSWKDVYLYWQLKTNDLLNCVNQPIPCKKIKVSETSDKRRVCYPSWLKNDYSRDIVPAFNRWMEMPLYDRDLLFSDERVSRSAKLMLQTRTEAERAAVWLFIFCTSFEKSNLPFPNNIMIEYVGAKARTYLEKSFQEWQFKYHHRFPHLFINATTVRNVVFQDYKAVVDYAIINSYMVMKEYTIVVFDSQSDAIQLPSLFDDLRKQ
ncbi:MAG: hypothetical protein IIT39_12315 [Clostridia bacterium]|nr:hypothetical protein [Clostridia bacterium]